MNMERPHAGKASRRWKTSTVAFAIAFATFGATAGAWMVLNYFRVQFYDSSVEGPNIETSPFWRIIAVQRVLTWPIRVSATCTALLMLFKIASFGLSLVVSLKERLRKSLRSNTP